MIFYINFLPTVNLLPSYLQYIQNNPCLTTLYCSSKHVIIFFILHSQEDCPLIDKKLDSREVPKHHVDDKEEEGSTPVMAIERMLWLSIYHMICQ